jgi:hypothetical protein
VRRLLIALAVVLGCAACADPAPGSRSAIVPPKPAAAAATSHAAKAAAHPVRHVFLIVLENESYANSYQHNPNPYLGKHLQRQGTLLTHYFGIGHYSLDNYIAMISGQAPNSSTSADCQTYQDFNGTTAPATLDAQGQAVGTGCVYPSNVQTLGDQLSARHISWRGYMDQMGATPSREQSRCGVPTLSSGGSDDTQQATPHDQYAARHNPFVYFHSLIDSGQCRQHVVNLKALPKALRHVATTPRFSFITPDLCDDGHDAPCHGKDSKGSSAGGLTSVDHFLSTWIPKIEKSKAYKKNGLIIITSDESETSDASSCCNEQPGPSDPTPGITGPGGGRIGTLLLGGCVRHGAKDAKPYNHYSLLRSLENLFGITSGGSDNKGHLGYAGASGLKAFGSDVYRHCPTP